MQYIYIFTCNYLQWLYFHAKFIAVCDVYVWNKKLWLVHMYSMHLCIYQCWYGEKYIWIKFYSWTLKKRERCNICHLHTQIYYTNPPKGYKIYSFLLVTHKLTYNLHSYYLHFVGKCICMYCTCSYIRICIYTYIINCKMLPILMNT